MNCFLFLRNATVMLEDGNTAYRNRFKADFKGPKIPFGALVHYLPITPKDKSRTHAFGSKLLPGVFLGYSQQAGGGWSGDLLLADWEALSACTDVKKFPIKRFKHKEVTPIMDGDSFRFPAAEAKSKQTDDILELPSSNPFDGSSSAPSAEAVDDDSPPGDAKEDPEEEKKADPDMPRGQGSDDQDF